MFFQLTNIDLIDIFTVNRRKNVFFVFIGFSTFLLSKRVIWVEMPKISRFAMK